MPLPVKPKKSYVFPVSGLSKGSLWETLINKREPHADDLRSAPPNALTAQMHISAGQAANNFRLAPKLSRQVARPMGSAAWTETQVPDSILT